MDTRHCNISFSTNQLLLYYLTRAGSSTVHYIILPGFFFPSMMSLASFTFAAMKLLPPDRSSDGVIWSNKLDVESDGVME